MHEQIITLATPVFFLLIGLEVLAARIMGRRVYHVNDAIGSLSLGIVSQLVGVFQQFLNLGLYAWVVAHWAIFSLSDSNPWVWIGALLGYDLCYYWLHRMGHETTVLWAAHVVHHQSEDYNLSTALRQTGSGALFGWIFYLPLALIGVPFTVFAVVALIDLLYQFWIHTELIGSHPVLDRIFATPSNHRVHHAVNERYVDRNYGGLLIIWDRIFGTFQPEVESDPPLYGTRQPLRSFNPLWANVEVYAGAMRDAWRCSSVKDAVLIWINPPGWRPADVAERFPKPAFSMERERFNPEIGARATLYCVVQFVLMLAMAVHFLKMQVNAPLVLVVAYFAYQVFSLTVLGALLERRPAALVWEAARLIATAGGVALTGTWFGFEQLPAAAEISILCVCAASALSLVFLRAVPAARGVSLTGHETTR